MFAYASLLALIAGSALVRADPVPTAPGPGDVFKVGGQCTFTWTPDTTGTWTEMNVELMTGSNTGMVHITTVATLDGTASATTSFSYDCPEVTPNAAIYFYQFSSPAAPSNLTWTTRFTIAASDGTTTDPTNATEPDGSAIPWGTGALVDPSTAKAAPTYLTSGSTASTVAETASTTAAAAGTTSAAAGTTSMITSKVASTAPAAPTTASTSTNTSAASTNATGASNGALSAAHGVDSLVVRAGVALGAAAFAFAVAL